MDSAEPWDWADRLQRTVHPLVTDDPARETVQTRYDNLGPRTGRVLPDGSLIDDTLTGSSEDWSFAGTMRFEDPIDFEYREVASSVWNQICWLVRNGMNGKPFSVKSESAPVTKSSGDAEIQWKGTGARHAAAAERN